MTPFLAFSIIFYKKKDVPKLLLSLQDQHNADVNFILFGLWMAKQCCVLSLQDYATLNEAVVNWRTGIVQPARALRRAIKEERDGSFEVDELYQHAKRLELEAEYIQQDKMFSVRAIIGDCRKVDNLRSAALTSLNNYAEFLDEVFPIETNMNLVVALEHFNIK